MARPPAYGKLRPMVMTESRLRTSPSSTATIIDRVLTTDPGSKPITARFMPSTYSPRRHGFFSRLDIALMSACGHIHQHCHSPVGRGEFEHVVELGLDYVLHLYVDGGEYVVAAYGGGVGPVDDAFGQRHFLVASGHSVEQAVEGLLESRHAVDLALVRARRAFRHYTYVAAAMSP